MKLQTIIILIVCILFPVISLGEASTVIPQVSLHPKVSVARKKDAQVMTTHIDRKEIKSSPVTNVSELLAQEQSIVRLTNNSIDGSRTALSIRGFGDNAAANSLILVDGFPLTNVSLVAPNFNSIALSDIERIDITQGSQGSLYGDQAVGGVVNIITRHPEKFIADIYLGLGSFHKTFFNTLIATKFSNGFFIKAVGFTDQWKGFREHNKQKNNMLFLQSGLDYARGTINLNLRLSNNSTLFSGGLSQLEFDNNPRQATNFKNFGNDKNITLQLFNKHEINSNWILETRLSRQQINGDGLISSAFHSKEIENILNPRLLGTVLNNKLILGYFGQNSQYRFSNALFGERVSAKQNHIYAQDIFALNSQWDITLGARAAQQNNVAERIIGQPYDSINRVFVTEQGLSYHPNNEWQFYLRRDGNFRFPKANEQTWTPPGTTSLQPQTGVSYEAGMIWNTINQKTQLNIYRLNLKNEIAFDPTETPTEPMGTFQNFSPTQRTGITLSEYFQLTPVLGINSQINYVNAKFASGPFSGNEIPSVPAINANAGITYNFKENWRLKYSALYTGSQFASLDIENIGKKLKGYWLNTAALQYLCKSYEVSFEVGNMFNQKYSAYTIFDATTKSYTYYPAIGRNYLLTFKFNLDE